MPVSITLTVTKGKLASKQFRYDQHEKLIIGRLGDCAIVLPESTVSRYHCLVEISPPEVMLCDFGSLNGTFLNGEKIGQRPRGMSVEEARNLRLNEVAVKSGDILGIGEKCEIRVDVSAPVYCTSCYGEISSAVYKTPEGLPLCAKCHSAREQGSPRAVKCEICGKPITGADRKFKICPDCRCGLGNALNHFAKQNESNGALQEIEKYRRIKLLGKGGMGEVWLAEDAAGKQFALKFMLPQTVSKKKGRASFLREAQLMGQLDHKNVIRQYETGEIGDGYYILMEYCKGGSVDKLMRKKGGKLSLGRATNIILQTLDGLIYTHGASIKAKLGSGEEVYHDGVVHRDFKPHNIFLSDGSETAVAKVADFGLAKAFEASGHTGITATGAFAGTMAFMPRQQYLDYRYAEPQVDVWAAAASYYYMLTGCFPRNFEGMLPHMAVLNNSAVPIREREPGLPKALAEVIDRALIDNPAIVVKSAMEFKTQIEQAL